MISESQNSSQAEIQSFLSFYIQLFIESRTIDKKDEDLSLTQSFRSVRRSRSPQTVKRVQFMQILDRTGLKAVDSGD